MSQTINMDVVEELLSLCEDGDPELLVDLVNMFLEDGPAKLEAIATGLQIGDLERVERAAHALKGSAGSLGAVRVGKDCETLQLGSRGTDSADLERAADALRQHFAEARSAFEELLSRYS